MSAEAQDDDHEPAAEHVDGNEDEHTDGDDSVSRLLVSDVEKVAFFSGNPLVELTKGIVHLYRRAPKVDDVEQQSDLPPARTPLVCIAAVPSYMAPAEFMQFLDDAHRRRFTQLRLVSDGSAARYMAIAQFRTQADADDFYREYHGRAYHSLEPRETCSVLFVAAVEFVDRQTPVFPVPTLPEAAADAEALCELPACPVCLERLDTNLSGVLTILCNHSFHCECLARWPSSSTTCPVCRFVHRPAPADNDESEHQERPVCSACGTSENVWICLVCGDVGCGRYNRRHALEHYQETMHTFSLEVDSGRVWDYAGDQYVHRLVQNKEGSLVEVPSGGARDSFGGGDGGRDGGAHASRGKKADSVTAEYNWLLAAQLESQRVFFEGELKAVREREGSKLRALEHDNGVLREQLAALEAKRAKERQQQQNTPSKAVKKLQAQVAELTKENETLSALNRALMKDRKQLQADNNEIKQRMEETRQEIGELQEQVRDLMSHFGAQEKLETIDGGIDAESTTITAKRTKGERLAAAKRR